MRYAAHRGHWLLSILLLLIVAGLPGDVLFAETTTPIAANTGSCRDSGATPPRPWGSTYLQVQSPVEAKCKECVVHAVILKQANQELLRHIRAIQARIGGFPYLMPCELDDRKRRYDHLFRKIIDLNKRIQAIHARAKELYRNLAPFREEVVDPVSAVSRIPELGMIMFEYLVNGTESIHMVDPESKQWDAKKVRNYTAFSSHSEATKLFQEKLDIQTKLRRLKQRRADLNKQIPSTEEHATLIGLDNKRNAALQSLEACQKRFCRDKKTAPIQLTESAQCAPGIPLASLGKSTPPAATATERPKQAETTAGLKPSESKWKITPAETPPLDLEKLLPKGMTLDDLKRLQQARGGISKRATLSQRCPSAACVCARFAETERSNCILAVEAYLPKCREHYKKQRVSCTEQCNIGFAYMETENTLRQLSLITAERAVAEMLGPSAQRSLQLKQEIAESLAEKKGIERLMTEHKALAATLQSKGTADSKSWLRQIEQGLGYLQEDLDRTNRRLASLEKQLKGLSLPGNASELQAWLSRTRTFWSATDGMIPSYTINQSCDRATYTKAHANCLKFCGGQREGLHPVVDISSCRSLTPHLSMNPRLMEFTYPPGYKGK